jgi:GcrA cell cycle regulator
VIAGLTCSEIAGEIGVTRNAVIGKLHRLGLSTGGKPGRKPSALARRMALSPKSARSLPRPQPRLQTRITRIFRAIAESPTLVPFDTSALDAPMNEGAKRCSLLELASGECRWPLGDPGQAGFGFCGHHTIAGISYCAGHARLAYRLPSGRRA